MQVLGKSNQLLGSGGREDGMVRLRMGFWVMGSVGCWVSLIVGVAFGRGLVRGLSQLRKLRGAEERDGRRDAFVDSIRVSRVKEITVCFIVVSVDVIVSTCRAILVFCF
jgi:hypothetical protein